MKRRLSQNDSNIIKSTCKNIMWGKICMQIVWIVDCIWVFHLTMAYHCCQLKTIPNCCKMKFPYKYALVKKQGVVQVVAMRFGVFECTCHYWWSLLGIWAQWIIVDHYTISATGFMHPSAINHYINKIQIHILTFHVISVRNIIIYTAFFVCTVIVKIHLSRYKTLYLKCCTGYHISWKVYFTW